MEWADWGEEEGAVSTIIILPWRTVGEISTMILLVGRQPNTEIGLLIRKKDLTPSLTDAFLCKMNVSRQTSNWLQSF